MRPAPVDSAAEIDRIARFLLRESKAFGVFPTPVDRIVSTAELQLAMGVDLGQVKREYFSRMFAGIGRVSRKVLGLLDFRSKTIYLDLQQNVFRQRFVKLHEVGHDALSWQEQTYRWDDRKALDPAVKELFEREASFFASSVLFQLELFDDEAAKLPLALVSALTLARKFGSSCQAAIRRYVQYSAKRCAVLVLEPPDRERRVRIRDCFESPSFAKEFGEIQWPEFCDAGFPFVADMLAGRRFRYAGAVGMVDAEDSPLTLNYQFFGNRFNGYAFLYPPGEAIRSRTRIVLARG